MHETKLKPIVATCEELKHIWPVWAQGGKIFANATLPGKMCVCGQKIIIQRFCSKCCRTENVVVDFNSDEAQKWLNDE